MELEFLKKELASQGLSKQQIGIVIDAIRGIQERPDLYEITNATVLKLIELKEFQSKAVEAAKLLGVGVIKPDAPKKPREKKTRVAKMLEEHKSEMKLGADPQTKEETPLDKQIAEEKKEKKKGGKVKGDAAQPTVKETVEEINDNIATLNSEKPDIDL